MRVVESAARLLRLEAHPQAEFQILQKQSVSGGTMDRAVFTYLYRTPR